jgi:hypothetical protein
MLERFSRVTRRHAVKLIGIGLVAVTAVAWTQLASARPLYNCPGPCGDFKCLGSGYCHDIGEFWCPDPHARLVCQWDSITNCAVWQNIGPCS